MCRLIDHISIYLSHPVSKLDQAGQVAHRLWQDRLTLQLNDNRNTTNKLGMEKECLSVS